MNGGMPLPDGCGQKNGLIRGDETLGSAGQGRARGHGVEPVVIGLVERMVRGMY